MSPCFVYSTQPVFFSLKQCKCDMNNLYVKQRTVLRPSVSRFVHAPCRQLIRQAIIHSTCPSEQLRYDRALKTDVPKRWLRVVP